MNRLQIYQLAAGKRRAEAQAIVADELERKRVQPDLFAAPPATDPNWCCVPNQDRPGVHADDCPKGSGGTRLLF